MDREQKEGSGKSLARQPKGPPALSLIDTGRKAELQDWRQLQRLAPMAAIAMLGSTLLACAFFVLGKLGHLSMVADYMGGFESFSLRALIFYGLVPLITASLMLAIYRPPLRLLAGSRPPLPVLLAAPAAGFLAGWLIWCLVRLAVSLFPSWDSWLAVPLIWQAASQYPGRTPLILALTFMVAVVLPASSHEFLYRGIIQPVWAAKERRFRKCILPALLAAVMALDLSGLVVSILLSLLISWARHASRSLIVSSLVSAGSAAAMILSRPLFGLVSQAVLKMPLIDPLRNRVFLVTMISISLVLLLAPLALVGAPARREKGALTPANREKEQPFRMANRVIGLLCIAVAVFCLYFFA